MPDMSHSSYMFTGFEANCNRNWVRRHLRGCDLTTTSHLCAVHLVHAGMWECLTLSSWHPKASEDLEFRGWRKVNKDLSKFRFARQSPLTAVWKESGPGILQTLRLGQLILLLRVLLLCVRNSIYLDLPTTTSPEYWPAENTEYTEC